jgi:hypothetical protein
MITHLLGSFDYAYSYPALGMIPRATTAIRYSLHDDLSPLETPEIAWRCSPSGMTLVQPIRFGESARVLLALDRPWQLLQDPKHAVAGALAKAELEYEAVRPIEPRALLVQPQDAALGLPPGEVYWLGSSLGRRYSAADIDQIRNVLQLTACGSGLLCQRAVNLLAEKPLTPETEARAREIVTVWDRHQADDVMALARSGLATWRRIAAQAGYDPMCLGQMRMPSSTLRSGSSRPIRNRFPWCGLPDAHNVKAPDAHVV